MYEMLETIEAEKFQQKYAVIVVAIIGIGVFLLGLAGIIFSLL